MNRADPSAHSRYAGSASGINGQAAGYDAKSIAVRSSLQRAADRAMGPSGGYTSKSPLVGGRKVDFLSRQNASDGARSVAQLHSDKLGHDEEDETAIYALQARLDEVKGQLGKAKFKYEQRQLYELDQQETRLVTRLQQIDEYSKQNSNNDALKEQIRR